jgi:hypothetical protein
VYIYFVNMVKIVKVVEKKKCPKKVVKKKGKSQPSKKTPVNPFKALKEKSKLQLTPYQEEKLKTQYSTNKNMPKAQKKSIISQKKLARARLLLEAHGEQYANKELGIPTEHYLQAELLPLSNKTQFAYSAKRRAGVDQISAKAVSAIRFLGPKSGLMLLDFHRKHYGGSPKLGDREVMAFVHNVIEQLDKKPGGGFIAESRGYTTLSDRIPLPGKSKMHAYYLEMEKNRRGKIETVLNTAVRQITSIQSPPLITAGPLYQPDSVFYNPLTVGILLHK